MTCPVCAAVGDPVLQLKHLAICGACGASAVQETVSGAWVKATAEDLAGLTAGELFQLRRARGALARPARR